LWIKPCFCFNSCFSLKSFIPYTLPHGLKPNIRQQLPMNDGWGRIDRWEKLYYFNK
jgi:hypothetical protein